MDVDAWVQGFWGLWPLLLFLVVVTAALVVWDRRDSKREQWMEEVKEHGQGREAAGR